MSWIDHPTDGRSIVVSANPQLCEGSRRHGIEIPFTQQDLRIQTRATSGAWPGRPVAVPSGSALWSWSPEATR
jgi:small-conductance mechanosensitive channel